MTRNVSFRIRAILIALLIGFVPLLGILSPEVANAQISNNEVNNVAPLNFLNEAKNAITSIFSGTTAESTAWTALKGQVLDPLAHALAQTVLKQITASVVNWINGQGSGGTPAYTQNLQQTLLQVSDRAALSFFTEITTQSNSPFAPAIASSLKTNYLQSTSVSGFWAANQCTLQNVSSNPLAFAGGAFNQGGWNAWFSLTTQPQNNPYTLYYRTQSELYARTGTAQTQKQTQLSWAQGFTSWCGNSTGGGGGANAGGSCKTDDDCAGALACINGSCAVDPSVSVPPGQCINKDGSQGTIQTPGSVIHDELSKTLGSGVDSLVSVHDFDQMVDTILSALATKVLSTGLSALSGGGASSVTSQLASSTSATDPNAASVASQSTSLAQTTLASLATYTAAWQTIFTAASTASSSVTQLGASCPTLLNDVQTAQANEIQPVLNSAQAAFAEASTTQALALQVEADATAVTNGSAGAEGALAADTQSLSAAPPSGTDIANVQSAAGMFNSATSSSPYSLLVTGGTEVDEMNLISKNAQNAQPFCGPPPLAL